MYTIALNAAHVCVVYERKEKILRCESVSAEPVGTAWVGQLLWLEGVDMSRIIYK